LGDRLADETVKKDDKSEDRSARAFSNLAAALNQLKGKVEAIAEAKPKVEAPAKKIYTRAELRAAVNAGNITEDQMDETLERQLREEMKNESRQLVTTESAAIARTAKIGAQIDTYIDAHPDLKDKESELFLKVAAKFNDLVSQRGLNREDLSTELLAMELVLGEPKPRSRKRELEATEEAGGSGGGPDNLPVSDGWAKGLSPKLKTFYENQIAKKIYKDTSDPRLVAELKRARSAH
jgi:hypothetical protein